MSRETVRSAFAILEAQGFLEAMPREADGWVVGSVTGDRARALAENRRLERVDFSHGEMARRKNKPPLMRHRWGYLRFTDPPDRPATAEDVIMSLAAVHERANQWRPKGDSVS